jgi:lantibiotic modifying enzyme
VVGFDLYDGLAGIALFLAGLSARTGDPHFHRTAQAALAEAVDLERGMTRETVSVGGYEGAGGLAWSLAVCARLLDQPRWAKAAAAIVRRHAPHAANDPDLDQISGQAGFLTTGLAIARMAGDASLAAALAPCAHGLAALPADALPLVDAGLAHGRAGIGLALARWAQDAGEETVFKRARALIDADIATSQAVRDGAEPPATDHDGRAMSAWCRGGVGASLGAMRLGLAPDREIQALVDAVTRAMDNDPGAALCLCHGDLGVLEFLEAGRAHGVPGAAPAEARLRGEVLARFEAGELCADHFHTIETPGLMRGLAGTGWALLRMLDPARPRP